MIIVTGGAGFIGSNIVKELNRRGRTDILVVDDLKDGSNYKNLRGLQFIDYQHKDDFLQSIENDDFDGADIDAVFHEGACSDTMEYDVNFMMKVNYEYSKSVLHFCLQHRIPFLYASSASTYGSGKNGFREGDDCEDALNPYAFSKLAFDRYVRQVLPEARSQIVGLKYFNVYGPQEHHKGKMASIFYQLYNQVNETGVARLFKGIDGYKDGEQRRDFVYVKDVVKVISGSGRTRALPASTTAAPARPILTTKWQKPSLPPWARAGLSTVSSRRCSVASIRISPSLTPRIFWKLAMTRASMR